MTCGCCRCAHCIHPTVSHPFDLVEDVPIDNNTLILPSTVSAINPPVHQQKKRQFSKKNASSPGLLSALRWHIVDSHNHNHSVNDSKPSDSVRHPLTSAEQMRESAEKLLRSLSLSQSKATTSTVDDTTQTTRSLPSSSSSPSETDARSDSHALHNCRTHTSWKECGCHCHTIRIEHQRSDINAAAKHSNENVNTANLSHSESRSTIVKPSDGALTKEELNADSNESLKSDTVLYKGAASHQMPNRATGVASSSGSRPASPSKTAATYVADEEREAALAARRAAREAAVERQLAIDEGKRAKVKADDKYYQEMMLKQFERRVKMQEFRRRHEEARLSKSMSQHSDRQQPQRQASLINAKPVFSDFGGGNTHTKIDRMYLKSHNITPDLPPNHPSQAQSYNQARRVAINRIQQKECVLERLQSQFAVKQSQHERKIAVMARSYPPPTIDNRSDYARSSSSQAQSRTGLSSVRLADRFRVIRRGDSDPAASANAALSSATLAQIQSLTKGGSS